MQDISSGTGSSGGGPSGGGPSGAGSSGAGPSEAGSSGAGSSGGGPLESKIKNRCLMCNKRVGLVGGFTCKCGGLFCGVHRSENTHDCSFNFSDLDMESLRGRLVRVGGNRGLD